SSGTVTNTGSIVGADGIVVIAAGTVVNAGMISGTYGTGIALGAGGSITNNAAGVIQSTGPYAAVYIAGGAGRVVNYATISGYTPGPVDTGACGVLAGSSTVGAGLTLTDFGTLTNTGSLAGAGVLIVDPATLLNTGSIGLTATLSGGGYLGNEATGTIAVAGT